MRRGVTWLLTESLLIVQGTQLPTGIVMLRACSNVPVMMMFLLDMGTSSGLLGSSHPCPLWTIEGLQSIWAEEPLYNAPRRFAPR